MSASSWRVQAEGIPDAVRRDVLQPDLLRHQVHRPVGHRLQPIAAILLSPILRGALCPPPHRQFVAQTITEQTYDY